MNNEPKKGQLCRHKKAKDCYREYHKYCDLTFWQPLPRSEIAELWKLAQDDGSELPEQVSDAMADKIANIIGSECSYIHKADVKYIMQQAGLIKQQKLMPATEEEPLPVIINWPDWAVCHAFDKHGRGYFYSDSRIETTMDFWKGKNIIVKEYPSNLTIDPTKHDWKTTLIIRPGLEKEKPVINLKNTIKWMDSIGSEQEVCFICGGDKEIEGIKCNNCEGTGIIKKEEENPGTILKSIDQLDNPVMGWVFDRRK